MHRSSALAAIAVSVFCVCQPNTASADGIGKGNVMQINSVAMNFVCACDIGTFLFQATNGTIFHYANAGAASFGSLKAGAKVTIRYHFVGPTEVTDDVSISY